MATLLSNKKSTYGSPYAYYTLEVTQEKRTPTTVTLKCKVTGYLQYSTSYLGTGNGMGLIAGVYIDGKWHTWTLKSESTKWSGTTKHSATKTITVDASAAISSLSVKFRVKRSEGGSAASLSSTSCTAMSITKISSKYTNVELTASASSQEKIAAKLSGIPKSTGYKQVVCWYKGSELVATQSLSSASTVTTRSLTFTGLHPSTTYKLKAVLRYNSSSGVALATKSISVKTDAETGSLSLESTASYIKVTVSGMYNGPSYTRKVLVYYKKTSASSYTRWSSTETEGALLSKTITGLSANTSYDVKVLIKNGDTTLRTLTKTIATKDTATFYVVEETNIATDIKTQMTVSSTDPLYNVPEPFIEGVTQIFGTTNCIVKWGTDRSVAGTTYRIQSKVPGGNWVTLNTTTSDDSPVTVTVPAEDTTMYFRILAKTPALADENKVSDDVSTFVQGKFKWDTAKTAGQPFRVTAAEWNRLGDYVASRYRTITGNSISITKVKSGELITANIYNTMKNHINKGIANVGVSDKKPGDAITAADIDALRIAANR